MLFSIFEHPSLFLSKSLFTSSPAVLVCFFFAFFEANTRCKYIADILCVALCQVGVVTSVSIFSSRFLFFCPSISYPTTTKT